MSASALYGWLAQAIVFGAAIALLPLGRWQRPAALGAIAVASVSGLAAALHGFLGAPSATLLGLALWRLLNGGASPLTRKAAWVVVGAGAVFYPLALGLGPFDPYGLGYQPWPLLGGLALAALVLWRVGAGAWLLLLAGALAAYPLGLFANLWDALIDPLLVAVAIGTLLKRPHKKKAPRP